MLIQIVLVLRYTCRTCLSICQPLSVDWLSFRLGIARIVHGIINKDMSRWSRSFLVGVGALSIAVSALVLIHPLTIGVVLLALSISIALLINGIQMMAVGIGGKQRYAKSRISKWSKIFFARSIRNQRIETWTLRAKVMGKIHFIQYYIQDILLDAIALLAYNPSPSLVENGQFIASGVENILFL